MTSQFARRCPTNRATPARAFCEFYRSSTVFKTLSLSLSYFEIDTTLISQMREPRLSEAVCRAGTRTLELVADGSQAPVQAFLSSPLFSQYPPPVSCHCTSHHEGCAIHQISAIGPRSFGGRSRPVLPQVIHQLPVARPLWAEGGRFLLTAEPTCPGAGVGGC